MEGYRQFWEDETAVGVVELILILVVLISLVIIFKKQLTALVNTIFIKVSGQAGEIYWSGRPDAREASPCFSR